MYPHHHVEPWPQLAARHTDALDQNRRRPFGNSDRARSATPHPGGRAIANRKTALMRRGEQMIDEQLSPPEERVVPGQIVCVNDRRVTIQRSQPLRQRGLARSAVAVDTHHQRSPAAVMGQQFLPYVLIRADTPLNVGRVEIGIAALFRCTRLRLSSPVGQVSDSTYPVGNGSAGSSPTWLISVM